MSETPTAYGDAGPRCNQLLQAKGEAYPRTCAVCGLGPCRADSIPVTLKKRPCIFCADDIALLNQRLIDRTSVYMDSRAKDVARINALESLLAQMAEAMEHNEREFPTWWSYDTKGKAALAAYRNYREESKS
jgi:hypothetical protein